MLIERISCISRATRGEASPEEVESEEWLLVTELQSKGVRIDLQQAEHRQPILARLYQQLVRYTELNVRYAVRLDHSPGGEDGEAIPSCTYWRPANFPIRSRP